MRKPFAIVALCCLLFLNVGYYVLYKFQLIEVKEGMKKEVLRARRHELSQFHFSPEDLKALHWENDHEFQFGGEMFDVLEVEKSGDTTIIWCLADKKEKALKEAFAKTQQQSPGKKRSGSIFQLLKAPYYPVACNLLSIPAFLLHHSYGDYITNLPHLAQGVITPPPKTC